MASELPPEIIEAILDATKPDSLNLDVGTLASVSLINIPWHIISRRMLFGTVTIRPETALRFVDLFASPKATLPEFVRALVIQRKQQPDTGHIDCEILDQLAPVTAKLPHLCKLCLNNIDWSTRKPIARESLRPYQGVTALELHHSKLSDLAQLADVISLFPVLEDLTFIYLTMITNMNALPSDAALHGRGVPMTLRRFTLVGPRVSVIESVMEWISGTPDGVDIPLEYLKLGGTGFRATKSVRRLLQGAGSHLCELVLHPTSGPFYPGWNNPDVAPTLLDLSANDQLRIISFEGAMQPIFCDAMLQILSQVTSLSLEEVSIPSVLPAASKWGKKIEALRERPPFFNLPTFNSNRV
ncbi:hypothetical protein BDZ89DRAFT_1072386 [Hymenopellis radicata]|nr:hypothetical protein BDZ89DRAFT_1072386 [Hymenopellis radicata]